MANAPTNSLAAALQAGASPQQAQRTFARSQYLTDALMALQRSGGQNIRSPAQLGLNLLAVALAEHGKRSADQGVAQLQRQVAEKLFPNDPQAQLTFLVAPGEVGANIAKRYAPIAARQGETVLNAPTPNGQFFAPVLRDDGGIFATQTPTGVNVTGYRPANYGEQTAQQNAATQQASQAEAMRHNQAMEGIDHLKIPIELAMARAALSNAGTNAGNLDLHQQTAPTFAVPQGYVLQGPQ